MNGMRRRRFFLTLAGATASVARPPLAGADGEASTVVLCRHERLRRIQDDLDRDLARNFLDRALRVITGAADGPAAWRRLFAPGERVGLKLSCLAGRPLSSSRGLVAAIVSGLRSAGVKPGHITIWDRSDRELRNAGFAIGDDPVHVFGTDHLTGGGYSARVEIHRSVGTCFSRIMERVDALISVPVLKDHDIAGVSIGLKNFYGAIHNPNKFHGNRCDPYVADLCDHPLIRAKLRLTVCDASRVQVHNGPAFFPRYAWEYGGILVSRDAVALDDAGWRIIETRRRELGMQSLHAEGRRPTYIERAAALGLGRSGEGAVRFVELG